MSVGEPHTKLSGIKQDLLDFKNEINSALVNIKTEMQSKFDDNNKRLNVSLKIILKVASITKLMNVCQILKILS